MVRQDATPTARWVIDSIDRRGSSGFVGGRAVGTGGGGRYRRRPVSASSPTSPATATPPRSAAPVRRRAVRVDRVIQAAAAIWTLAVVVLSLVPDDPSADVAWDKTRHATAYGVLTILALAVVWRAGRPPNAIQRRARGAVLTVAVVVLGGIIEVLQAKVVDRDGSLGDLLADAIGVAAAAAMWTGGVLVTRRRRADGRRDDTGLSVERWANPRQ
jgi:VanZ family protein